MTMTIMCLMTSLMSHMSETYFWMIPMMMMAYLMNNVYNSTMTNMTSLGLFNTDMMSSMMMLLTLWVFNMSMMTQKNKKSKMFNYMMMTLSMMCFSVDNLFMFYTSFEVMFMTMFAYLLKEGKSMERLQASMYMLFYTMTFSLPFLILLSMLYEDTSSTSLMTMKMMKTSMTKPWMVMIMMMVFIVKLPLYSVHLWLPKAHVQAPTEGSMILAGVLLKLGAYGMMRFPLMMNSMTTLMSSTLSYLCLMGMTIMSIMCMRQTDLKMMVAYSSIVHMSMMTMGILSFSDSGMNGAIIMNLSHGFISMMLFFNVGYSYEKLNSRSTMMTKGIMSSVPMFTMFWFLANMMNMSTPPSMPFFAEINILGSLNTMAMMETILLYMGLVLTGLYCTIMYTNCSHGKQPNKVKTTYEYKTMTMNLTFMFYPATYMINMM